MFMKIIGWSRTEGKMQLRVVANEEDSPEQQSSFRDF